MATDPDQIRAPQSLREFGRALGIHLPRQLTQLRRIGKQTRALSGRRPKKQG